jgi:CheY-like chemotaxis protein
MEAVGRLASGIAHDFNSLLWPIVLYSEMLERTPGLDERSRGMLADMQQAARRAGELVQQVLAISRRRDRVLELVHIAEVVAGVGQIAARMAPPGVEVRCATDADAGHILGDAGAFHEAAMHLASNALEAMQGRTGTVELAVDRVTRAGRDWVRVVVRDEGPGIPEAIRVRLLDPYFAADPVRAARSAPQTSRHGLGLGVVRRVVAEMEGRIEVASELGRGTAFEILLPVLRENEGDPSVSLELAEDAAPVARPAPRAAVAASVAPAVASPGGERILLADDDPAVLEVAEQMLLSLGYEVTAVRSGVDALVHLQNASERFALLLTDLTMPGMDGIELAREARRLRPNLPVVCCTGFGNERTERRAFEAGMSAFLRKPIDFDSYASTVRAAIDGTAGK